MPFTVVDDKGVFFADIKQSDLRVKGERGDLLVASFGLRTDVALDVLFLIDVSISQERVLPTEKAVVEQVIDSILSNKRDRVAVGSIADSISLSQAFTSDFTAAKKSLQGIKVVLPPGYIGGGIVAGPPPKSNDPLTGATSLWDGVSTAINALSSLDSKSSRKVLVLISDGVNTAGKVKFEAAVNSAVKAGIPILAIGIADSSYGGMNRTTLKKLSDGSGGLVLFPRDKLKDMPELAKRAEQILRNYYELSFANVGSATNDKPIEVKIEVTNPDLKSRKLDVVAPGSIILK